MSFIYKSLNRLFFYFRRYERMFVCRVNFWYNMYKDIYIEKKGGKLLEYFRNINRRTD